MKTLTWQKPGQQNVAQELIKIIINYVAELRFITNGSAYLITTTGSKGASVSKLGGNANAEFREDSSGNVYVLSTGIYFIIQIGYNISNIIAEEINDFPSDSTSLVVS